MFVFIVIKVPASKRVNFDVQRKHFIVNIQSMRIKHNGKNVQKKYQ